MSGLSSVISHLPTPSRINICTCFTLLSHFGLLLDIIRFCQDCDSLEWERVELINYFWINHYQSLIIIFGAINSIRQNWKVWQITQTICHLYLIEKKVACFWAACASTWLEQSQMKLLLIGYQDIRISQINKDLLFAAWMKLKPFPLPSLSFLPLTYACECVWPEVTSCASRKVPSHCSQHVFSLNIAEVFV